jgi:hypothetical protein
MGDWDESKHPRAENGKFGEGSGGSDGGAGDKPARSAKARTLIAKVREKRTAPAAGGPVSKFTPDEHKMMVALATKKTDKQIREATGLSQEQLIRAGASVRSKLDMPVGALLRNAAKDLHRSGALDGSDATTAPPSRSDAASSLVEKVTATRAARRRQD